MTRCGLSGAALGAVLAVCAARPAHGETLRFAHRDRHFLRGYQHEGGAVLLPERPPGAPVPLVVFLHGTNRAGDLHLWLGGGGRDLRPLARQLMHEQQIPSFALAAPSQTKNAVLARTLWAGFTLGRFVDDVQRATQGMLQIDAERVVVIGHSGAGCNPNGGLAGAAKDTGGIAPLAVVSIDPCLDARMGAAMSHRPSTLPLWVYWQASIWRRSPESFWHSLVEHEPDGRVDHMKRLRARGTNPHEAIVPDAFERAVRQLLEPPAGPQPDGDAERVADARADSDADAQMQR